MSVGTAFDDYQRAVDEDPKVLQVARARREAFKRALLAEPDVAEVWSSGSLRRSTQIKPLRDLDLVVVFDEGAHPSWGTAGDSAQEALTDTGARINALLGATHGTVDRLVRRANPATTRSSASSTRRTPGSPSTSCRRCATANDSSSPKSCRGTGCRPTRST